MFVEVVKIRDFVGHTQAVYALSYDPQTQSIYSGAGDGMIVQWQLSEPDGKLVIRHNQAVYTLFCDQQYLISGTRSGIVSAFFLEDYSLKKHLQLCDAPIFEIVKYQSTYLIVAGDGNLYELDHDFNILRVLSLSDKPLRTIEIKDNEAIIGASDACLYFVDLLTFEYQKFAVQNSSVFAVATLNNGEMVCGGRDATLTWIKNKEIVRTIKAHLLHIHRIKVNPYQVERMASSSMDKTIKYWNSTSGELLKVVDAEKFQGHTSSVNKILWIDKNTLISCSDDRTLKCFVIQEK